MSQCLKVSVSQCLPIIKVSQCLSVSLLSKCLSECRLFECKVVDVSNQGLAEPVRQASVLCPPPPDIELSLGNRQTGTGWCRKQQIIILLPLTLTDHNNTKMILSSLTS